MFRKIEPVDNIFKNFIVYLFGQASLTRPARSETRCLARFDQLLMIN